MHERPKKVQRHPKKKQDRRKKMQDEFSEIRWRSKKKQIIKKKLPRHSKRPMPSKKKAHGSNLLKQN